MLENVNFMAIELYLDKSKKRKRAAAELVDDYNEDSLDSVINVNEAGKL